MRVRIIQKKTTVVVNANENRRQTVLIGFL